MPADELEKHTEARPHRRYLEQHKEGSGEARKTLAVVEAIDAMADRLVAAILAAPDPAPPDLSAFFGTLPAEAENNWPPPGAPGGGA